MNAETDVNDGVFNITLASAEPIIHDMVKMGCRKNPPVYMKAVRETNFKKMIGVSLRIGQENIAVMNLHTNFAVKIYSIF